MFVIDVNVVIETEKGEGQAKGKGQVLVLGKLILIFKEIIGII